MTHFQTREIIFRLQINGNSEREIISLPPENALEVFLWPWNIFFSGRENRLLAFIRHPKEIQKMPRERLSGPVETPVTVSPAHPASMVAGT